jgi:hypothetical protein
MQYPEMPPNVIVILNQFDSGFWKSLDLCFLNVLGFAGCEYGVSGML